MAPGDGQASDWGLAIVEERWMELRWVFVILIDPG
jgi:hypothetical protein